MLNNSNFHLKSNKINSKKIIKNIYSSNDNDLVNLSIEKTNNDKKFNKNNFFKNLFQSSGNVNNLSKTKIKDFSNFKNEINTEKNKKKYSDINSLNDISSGKI